MAIMHQTDQADWQIEKGLFEIQRGYDALISTRQTPHEKLATAKAALDEQWQSDMLPVMEDLYWYPFRNGIAEAPEDAEELRGWLSRKYDDEIAILALLLLLRRYQRRAYDLGGQTALDFLGIDTTFRLTNEEIVAALDAFAADLVRQGTELSLIDTTIDNLVEDLQKARLVEGSTLLALSAYIALRAQQRTAAIERSERPRQVAAAMDTTYLRNGVAYKMYDVAGVGCPRVCAPWHGTVAEVGQYVGSIPQHPFCDCIWASVLYDGQVVGSPPVVVHVTGLPPWIQPVNVWTGD